MRKREEINDPNSCLNKAKEDEMIFVLLGRDEGAVAAVLAWINMRIKLGKNNPRDAQIVEAEKWIETVLSEREP